MKRTRVLRLVLLGGGAVAMVAGCGPQTPTPRADQTQRFACEQARQQNLPNAQEICERAATATSSSSGTSTRHYSGGGGGWWLPWLVGRSYGGSDRSYTGSWFSGRSTSTGTSGFNASPSTSSRGGFGATASSGRSSGS